MVRTKQVPIVDAYQKKVRNNVRKFFSEAESSTPNSDGVSVRKKTKEAKDADASSSSSESSERLSSISKGTSKASSSRKSGSSRRGSSPPKRPRKRGVAALQEIRRLQRSTHLLIPRAAFVRVVRDVLRAEEKKRRKDEAGMPDGFAFEGMRFTPAAFCCLQEAAEVQLTNFFTLAYYCSRHCGRVTLMVKDCQLTRRIRGRDDPLNP